MFNKSITSVKTHMHCIIMFNKSQESSALSEENEPPLNYKNKNVDLYLSHL